MKKVLIFTVAVSFIVSCSTLKTSTDMKLKNGLYAEMFTTKGKMIIELYPEKTPITVANFVGLAEGTMENEAKPLGTPYYDGIVFHRVIKDFMIQGGDPDGIGSGGPGYSFEDEFHPDLKHDKKGVLSMANSGPGTNGSQFFITHKETPWLNNKHSIFGQVIDGIDVVDSLANVKTGANDRPKDSLLIEKIEIHKLGDYKKYDAVKAFEEGKIEAKRKREEAERKRKEHIANILEEATKAESTASGLKYVIRKKGEGAKAVKGDSLNIHYTLWLENGNKIDSSYDRDEALSVVVGKTGLIQGWLEALTLFERGSEVLLVVPPELGYGARGAGGGVIPGNATLYFEMKYLED